MRDDGDAAEPGVWVEKSKPYWRACSVLHPGLNMSDWRFLFGSRLVGCQKLAIGTHEYECETKLQARPMLKANTIQYVPESHHSSRFFIIDGLLWTSGTCEPLSYFVAHLRGDRCNQCSIGKMNRGGLSHLQVACVNWVT